MGDGVQRLLIVDDDRKAIEVLVRIFERAGYEVDRSDSTADATFQVISAVEPYACVIGAFTDGGADAAVAFVTGIWSHPDDTIATTRVVLVPTSGREARDAWEAGVDGFAARPVYEHDMIAEVNSAASRDEADREFHRAQQLAAIDEGAEGPRGLQ